MARTKQTARKQTARKQTGGKAPKKQSSSPVIKKKTVAIEVDPDTSFTFTAKQFSDAFEKASKEAADSLIQELLDA